MQVVNNCTTLGWSKEIIISVGDSQRGCKRVWEEKKYYQKSGSAIGGLKY